MRTSISLGLATLVLLTPALVLARTTYETPYLACVPTYSTVSAGTVGHFVVATNVDGPFTWVVDDFAFIDAGPVFVTPFEHPGTHQVTVVWGSKRASCFVQVVGVPGYGEPFSYMPYGSYASQPMPNITLSFVKLSATPYTGDGIPLAPMAIAAALLSLYAVLVYPYARKAFYIVTR
jgi:hypothetical protein